MLLNGVNDSIFMLKELIDKFYLDEQKNKQQAHFYVTDAGKCPRAVFFKLKNAPRKKLDARILRIFEIGENFHRNIFNILYRLRIGVVTEVIMPKNDLVSGRADAILCIDNENYVLDIKSINSMIFRTMKEPKEENVYQIQLYLHYFNIKKGILLYIDKDKQDIREFYVAYNDGLVKSLLKDFKELKKKVDSNIIPERFSGYPKNWQCMYCQFKDICSSAGAKEINWGKFKEKIDKTTI